MRFATASLTRLRPRKNKRQGGAGLLLRSEYGRKPGIWVTDRWGKKLEGTPFSEATRKEMLARWAEKPVVPPLVYDYPGDAISRQLDSMSLEDYFVRTYRIGRETVRLMDASEAAGGFGLGPDALSAYLV
jgi:spermidine dehydrogenase